MITKRPKVVILFVGFTLLGAALAIGSGNGNADGTVDMNLRIAGTFITAVQYVAPSTGEATAGAFGQFKAKGSPGRADITLFGTQDQAVGFPPDEDCCGGPACLLISIIENPLVFTFDDLSLLFSNTGPGGGELCLDLFTGRSTGTIDIEFTGGTGRFEGATGEAVIVFETESVSSDGSFSGETGTIVGEIVLP